MRHFNLVQSKQEMLTTLGESVSECDLMSGGRYDCYGDMY